MAADKHHKNHEEMRVKVEQAKREVLPAVELEKKEIKMMVVPPEASVPSIVMTTFDDRRSEKDVEGSVSEDAGRIVGISVGPQGGEEETLMTVSPGVSHDENLSLESSEASSQTKKQTPSSPKLGSRLTVETENLMEFFEDKKKSQGLSPKRSSSKKKRTPSPSPIRQSIGLDHLDNLVRLMEQLGSLRDENSRLKHRCDYLESTKTLLIAKSSLDEDDVLLQYLSLPRSKKGKSQSTKSSKSDGAIRLSRPRLPSAEDAQFLEAELIEPGQSRLKGKLYKRSYSTGSLEVPSDIMEQSGEDELGSQRLLDDTFMQQHVAKLSKSPESKRKSKFSKWAKVKKVLNKQQVQEHITSGIKSIKGFGKGAYWRYGSVSGRELAVPSVAESRSVDSGVGSGMDGELQDVRKSTSSGEPPSPTRFIERHIDVPTPQVDDCMGIWLGPPEWIEKEREKEQQLLKQSGAGLSESPKSEPGDLGSPKRDTGYDEEGEQFLQVPIPRRQSSPQLLDTNDEEELDDSHLKRTASCKEGEVVKSDETFQRLEKGEKKHRTPWGKMKNIIHTRKDSVKKKRKRDGDTFMFEEVSETDYDVYDEMKYLQEGYLEGPVSRSTPKTSPVVFRQKQREKSSSNSPPGKGREAMPKVPMSSGSIDVTALLGGVTDEFTRKLQEWEELKGKRSSGHFKESPEFSESVSYESAGAVSPEFLKKLEEWEKVKALKGISGEKKSESQIAQEADSSSDETEDVSTPPERQRPSVNVEEIQRKLTDSFSRKMEEWERQKYQRQSSSQEGRDTPQKTSFKDRPKSKKTKEEKEREKIEKMREREILRVEREEQKLEKERLRIEKERLKALEREAKIEKMKGRLSQPDMESSFKNPILSPLTDYKVTSDFARKLHEWEVRKGKEMSTAMYIEAQKRSLQFSREYQNATNILTKNGESGGQTTTDTDDTQMRKTSSESDDLFVMEDSDKSVGPGAKPKGQKPPPLTLVPCGDSSEPEPSPKYASDDSSLDDHTIDTMQSMTQANISSLEKANFRLLQELRERELEYNALQEDVKDLNDRLVNFRNEHALELDVYRSQLEERGANESLALDTQHMSHTLMHLEDKITELKKFGEQLAMSMEGAAVGKFQTVEGEESINNRLVDLLDKMRLLLQQATLTGANTLEEVSKKSSALHNFEKLYSQAMQLQVQMNNLRLSQLERNKEIMNMKRHLLMQEANNLLLQADVTRREAELMYYKEYSQKRTPIKRWNTYSGREDTQARLPGQEIPQKQSIFQRVQRLRSARPLISSTTDSDSDAPPARRESPRVRKRESPKMRKKESPKTRKRESPSLRRKQESPLLRKKESPKLATHHPILEERSIERCEEHVKILEESKEEYKHSLQFSTVVLPTAKVTMPKDISPHEMNGVPRSLRDKGGTGTPKQKTKLVKETSEKAGATKQTEAGVKQTVKGTEAKFPELLIPEWKKKPDKSKKTHLQRMPCIDPDDVFETDDVFIDKKDEKEAVSEYVVPVKTRKEEFAKKGVDVSFDSSETSEDTLKYLSPDASPAPKIEPPQFPTEIKIVQKSPVDIESASDPGQSRPTSIIKVSVERHGTPVLLRKPPSGQQIRGQGSRLNIPVIPLRRIKPAQELLEDSQRYRSGHSIYLTRILKRYPMKIECRSRSLEDKRNAQKGKENIKEGYVKTMVKQLSREGTPGTPEAMSSPKLTPKQGSSVSITRTDSPKSEFVQQIVRKLSTPCGPTTEKATTPLKDLTNEGQVKHLTQAFANGSSNGVSDDGTSKQSFVSVILKGSQERLFSYASSTTSSTLTFSQLSTKTEPGQDPDSTISTTKVTYSSMPMLSLENEDGIRDRSATTSNGSRGSPSSPGTSYSPRDSPSQRHRIHVAVSMSPGRSRRVIDPSLSPARLRRLLDPVSPSRRIHEPLPIEQVLEEPLEPSLSVAQSQTLPSVIDIKTVSRRSPKSKKKDKSKMGTIGALCRQSMTFDLGVTLQSADGAEAEAAQVRHSTSSATSTSSQSETEGAVGTSGEKKKSRNKFLDSAFIQKSRKFFKVSKENRCPSLECCGSDRELLVD